MIKSFLFWILRSIGWKLKTTGVDIRAKVMCPMLKETYWNPGEPVNISGIDRNNHSHKTNKALIQSFKLAMDIFLYLMLLRAITLYDQCLLFDSTPYFWIRALFNPLWLCTHQTHLSLFLFILGSGSLWSMDLPKESSPCWTCVWHQHDMPKPWQVQINQKIVL